VDEGQVILTHAACGKSPAWMFDYGEALIMEDIPVKLDWDRTTVCHCEYSCDCDWAVTATPVNATQET
jgi:hypothetical protein